MGSSSIVGLSNAINYPRYTRVINGDVILLKENIWLNGHKVRIGGNFSDAARVLNRHAAKTGVKAEVVRGNNGSTVARLKLTVRGHHLAINDPKGIFQSLQMGKNIGASDKMLVQIVCKGKVSWSCKCPTTHLAVHGLVSEDNKKILNRCRQAHNQVHGQEEIEDHHVEVDSDDEQIVEDEFATDPLSPPSLLLGSAPRFRVVSQMPSLLGEMEDELVEVDSDDEQQLTVEDDFTTPLSSQSRLRGSGQRFSFIDQRMLSFQPGPSSLDEVESDPSMPRLNPFVTPMKKGNSAVVEPRLRPGPRWSIEQPRSDSFATLTQERDSTVVASKSAPSRRVQSRSQLPTATPPARKHSSIKGKGDAGLDFRAKLTWLDVRGKLPAKYASGKRFTESDRSAILSLYDTEHSKAHSLKLSRIAPPSAPLPARKSQSITGHGEAGLEFKRKLNWLKANDPGLPKVYKSKLSFSKQEKSAINSRYDKIRSPGAPSPITEPLVIPPAYSSKSLSVKPSSSSVGVDIVT